MRKINNTPAFQKKVNEFYDTVFDDRDRKFKKPAVRLTKLLSPSKVYTDITRAQKEGYINLLLANLDKIMRVQPNFIAPWKILFDQQLPSKNMTQPFAEAIQWALCYEDMREIEFPKLYQGLEIKTCVYCHSQLTVVLDKEFYKISRPPHQAGDVKLRIARLELDHSVSKDKHPFLSASFYNLYPVCANCNKAKSNNGSHFSLYADGGELDVFVFGLDSSSVLNYWTSRNIKDIKISFRHVTDDLAQRRLYNNMFDIHELYQTQLDIVEELIHKKEVYTKLYRDALNEQFEDLFPDKALIKRLIIGNYDKADEVHKRPMAKFMQDIARDLKLI